ncbi:hypothetical protein MKX50_24715 [Paenibacillus sp. FSL W8-0186]|uniref:hypothetical protein n=1 Tax=Paenibacillus sp. FSL W8-0186 TaxID=2921709 RepID=UPI0030CBDEAF
MLLWELIKMVAYFWGTAFLTSKYMNPNEGGIDHLHLIWAIVSFLMIAVSTLSGIKSAKWELNTQDDFLLQNVWFSEQIKHLLLRLEHILWDAKQWISFLLPVLAAIVWTTRIPPLHAIWILALSFLVFTILTQGIAALYSGILKTRDRSRAALVGTMAGAIIARTVIVALCTIAGRIAAPWVNTFPLIQRELDVQALETWQREGSKLFMEEVQHVLRFLLESWWPHVALADLFMLQASGWLILWAIVFGGAITGTRLNAFSRRNRQIAFNKILETLYGKLHSIVPAKDAGLLSARIKVLCRSSYTLRNLQALFGGIGFWILIGIFSGMLSRVNVDKIEYAVLSFMSFMIMYFLSFELYSSLSGKISLEASGERIILDLMAERTLWNELQQQWSIHKLLAWPIFAFGQLVVILLSGKFSILLLLLLPVQAIYVWCFTLICHIPSVIHPRFDYLNPEQIQDYPEKEVIRGITHYIVLGVILPVALLPLILYMADYIEFSWFISLQYIVIPGLMFGVAAIGLRLMKAKLHRWIDINDLHLK